MSFVYNQRRELYLISELDSLSRCRPGMPSADTHTLRLASKLADLQGGVCEPAFVAPRRTKPSSNPRSAPPKERKNGIPNGIPFSLEVQAGFEPADNGVADRGLTTWLLHQTFDCHIIITEENRFVKPFFTLFFALSKKNLSFLFLLL